MNRYSFMIALSLTLFVSSQLRAQVTQAQFHEKVLKTYSFSPHKLTSKEQEENSKNLDAFWEYVKGSTSELLPLLRIELKSPTSPPFFCYDGSMLLLSLSDNLSDKDLTAGAIAKCDLHDVSPSAYLWAVNRLANDGVDVQAAAFRILDDPSFQAFYPRHSLKLNQDYSFVCAVFPMADSLFVDACISRLNTTTNDTTAMTLILALWHTTTQEGFDAILAAGSDTVHSPQVQEYAKKKSEELILLMGKLIGQPSPGSYDELKEKRRASLKTLSDECLYEFDSLTQQLQVAFFNKR